MEEQIHAQYPMRKLRRRTAISTPTGIILESYLARPRIYFPIKTYRKLEQFCQLDHSLKVETGDGASIQYVGER